MYSHPVSPITNDGFEQVQIAYDEGKEVCVLTNGEAHLLPYGIYRVTIPEINVGIRLFKNNRGSPILRSSSGMLVVETDANCSVMPNKKQNKSEQATPGKPSD